MRVLASGVILAIVLMVVSTSALAADQRLSRQDPPTEDLIEVAVFNGELVSMDLVWERAQACLVWPEKLTRPECFDSESEMDQRIEELENAGGDVAERAGGLPNTGGSTVAEAVSECSGWLRLYDGTGYTGQTMSIRVRLQWLNLSSFGFDQKTSSFKIGPCSAYFADWSNGGGAWYPTNLTQAYDVGSSMISGWNNDVSSLYIN